MFKCPICLEQTEHEKLKHIHINRVGSLTVCPFCYHVIMTLRKSKKHFGVEIQKFEPMEYVI